MSLEFTKYDLRKIGKNRKKMTKLSYVIESLILSPSGAKLSLPEENAYFIR